MPKSRVHDFTAAKRHFGHDYALTPDADPHTARISGWGSSPREGDMLLLSHPDGGEVYYQLTEVRYPGNPADQWFGSARFVPRASELGQRAASLEVV